MIASQSGSRPRQISSSQKDSATSFAALRFVYYTFVLISNSAIVARTAAFRIYIICRIVGMGFKFLNYIRGV